MKYKVIAYHNRLETEEDGTCEVCFHTVEVDKGSLILENEKGKQFEIKLSYWNWGWESVRPIDNVVNFNAWLQATDLKGEPSFYWLRDLVDTYYEEMKEAE